MKQRKNIKSLTGFRAIAAYFVFFSHFTFYPSTIGQTLSGMLKQGYIGVTLFFVLSGFLITHCYWKDKAYNTSFYRYYLWRRFIRIYPVYLLSLLATIIILSIYGIFFHKSAIYIIIWLFLQITLLKGYIYNLMFSGVPQAWSLTLECSYYFIAPWIVTVLKKRLGIVIIILFYLLGLLSVFNFNKSNGVVLADAHFVFLYTIFGRIFDFIIGTWLALNISSPKKILHLRGKTYIGLIGMIGSLWVLHAFQGDYRFGFYSPLGAIWNNGLLPIFTMLFIAGLIKEKTAFRKILSTRLFQILGKASYTFYLFQFFLMGIILHTSHVDIRIPHSGLVIFSSFIALNLLSIIIYYSFEHPIHSLLKNGVAPALFLNP